MNEEANPNPLNKRVLLAVLAHPDDETFGMGGTLALYARAGVRVHLVCATRGEAGEVAPEMLVGFSSIAERRVDELSCAAGILGLAGVHFLDYRDSGMTGSVDNQHPEALCNAPVEEVAEKVAHWMRLLQPQVVLTFDPIGGYRHPDHIAVHRAAVQAFHLAGEAGFEDELPPFQPHKLYLHVFPKRMLRLAVTLMPLFGVNPRRFGRNHDVDLLSLVREGDFPVHAQIDYREVAEQRLAAAACHASQLDGGPPNRGPLAWVWRRLGHTEQFMRLYPPVQGKLREKDLFS